MLPVGTNGDELEATHLVDYVQKLGSEFEQGPSGLVEKQGNCDVVKIFKLSVLSTKPNSQAKIRRALSIQYLAQSNSPSTYEEF